LITVDFQIRALREAGLVPGPVSAVRMPTHAWESTYREEDRLGRELAERPVLRPQDRRRARLHAVMQVTAESISSRFAEVIAVWAER
jgi:hypothetical protein